MKNNFQDALNKVNKYKYNNPGELGRKAQFSKNSSVFATEGLKANKNKNEAVKQDKTDAKNDNTAENNQSVNNNKDVVCYGCGKPGHIKPKCPNKKANNKEQKSHQYVTKSSFYCTTTMEVQGEKNDAECKVIKTRFNVSESSPMSLLFDSCAQTSIV